MHRFYPESPAAQGRRSRLLLLLGGLAAALLMAAPATGSAEAHLKGSVGNAEGGPPGSASGSVSSLEFATQPEDTLSPPKTLTVTNVGPGELQVGTVTVSGAEASDFLITHDSCSGETISTGSTCQVAVRFAPSAPGARSATLEVPSNDPRSPLEVAMSGQGGALPEGPEGPKGEEGAEGPAGPRGRTGAEGSEGSEGPRGVKGAQGPPGPPAVNGRSLLFAHPGREIELVACNARGRACRASWLSGTSRFATLATLHLKLVHFGAVYATGGPNRRGAVLRVRRHMGPGSYKLILTFHSGQMLITVRRQLIIR